MGDEGRRFLRYVMPGLVYGVETLLFLIIALPEPTVSFLVEVSGKDAFGTIAGVFLASGALGFIFSSIHHYFLWHCEKDVFDHRKVIQKLYDLKKITLDKEDIEKLGVTGTLKDTLEAREIAQSLSLAVWYSHLKPHEPGKDQLALLGNQAHGLGTARFASLFAIFTTVGLCVRYGTLKLELWPTIDYILMLSLGVFAFCVCHIGYKRVARFAQKIYDKTIVELQQ
jgi:hypothetical protein